MTEAIRTDNTETLVNALERIADLEKENAELKNQIEKMKSDVRTNIRVANQSENNQMYFKLNSMINQWELDK